MADDIPPDVNPPDLRQVWGDHGGGDYGPLMDGTVRLPPPDPQATQETSPPTKPPNVRPYRVSPFSIAGVVSRILKETETPPGPGPVRPRARRANARRSLPPN